MSDDEEFLRKLKKNSSNSIVIKTTNMQKAENITKKELKHIEEHIDKLNKEKSFLNFKKEDYSKTIDELIKNLENSRRIRDEQNNKKNKLKQKKISLEARKDQLLAEKRDLGLALEEEQDKGKKKQLYDKFSLVKNQLSEVFEELKQVWDSQNSARDTAKEHHENMQVYYQLQRQLQNDIKSCDKQIRKINQKLGKLYDKKRTISK
ncbi:MAG: hypothetical protein INQ03_20720 [Candidatus Heimdallarchaeota archaeon]|nr:hypothetical protein [Candidatus Heimdallarchaeota archaeon]